MHIYSRKKRLEIKVFQMKTSQGKICRLSRLKEILLGGDYCKEGFAVRRGIFFLESEPDITVLFENRSEIN